MKRSEFIACLATLSLCGLPSAAFAHATLYERLGGELPLHLVVDGLYNRMLASPVTRERFSDTNMPHLKSQVFNFLAQAAGGPEKYVGKDLRAAHGWMKITEAEWAATRAALLDTLDNCLVPSKDQRDVLALIESLKSQIVSS